LAEYREKFLTYNDDIQGTAAVTVAGLLGAIKLKKPECTDLISELTKETFLFHGAGSANIGALLLLRDEAHVPQSQLFVTNSRGIIWKTADGKDGSYRNDEQKEFAQIGKPNFDGKSLVAAVENLKPTSIIGAVGRDPNCFNKEVIEAMVKANPGTRPGVYALSNPKTQAEVSSTDCWKWSNGQAIYGSGTGMETFELNGKKFCPGQVNNVYIFPGMSMGAVCCKAKTIPERLFMVAAEAVANSLDAQDLKEDRTVPHPDKIRIVGLNVATAVVLEAQKMGLAGKTLGKDAAEVKAAIQEQMWSPTLPPAAKRQRTSAATKVPAATGEPPSTLVGA
jgi:malate dehydrogenase (oxaloacetate-decarboxylating)(NADP+)